MKFNSCVKIFLFAVLFLGMIFVVSAKDQSISVNYNASEEGYKEFSIDYSNVKVKVNTINNSICKYDTSNFDYASDDVSIFQLTGDKYHYFDLLNLGDGTYKYYIKCKNSLFSGEPKTFKIVLSVNSLVKAQIDLDKEAPLKEGRVNVNLITSKPVSNTPSLTYSFDGTKYNPLVLVGSGKVWEGSIVLDDSIEEGVLSFKFKANDLEGRQGTEITAGAYFDYDLVKPKLITDIDAVSEEGSIEIEWYYDEDYDEFNIYRSEFENPDYVDFYKSVDETEFIDTMVEDGKTYYYRVAAIDSAGNEADLSKEVSGTSLSSSASSQTSGLSPQLLGLVESFVSEINSVDLSLSDVESRVDSFTDVEKEIFDSLGLGKKVLDARSELNSIKSSAERWKGQDLTREDLVSKIDSHRLKLEVLEKGIPSDIYILDEFSVEEDSTDEEKSLALMEIDPTLTEKEIKKSIEKTNEFIEDNSVSVISNFYDVEIEYLDGKMDSYSVVKRQISGEIERMQDSYFVERVPSSVNGDFYDVEFRNRNYDLVKEGSVFSFSTDTKEIFYSVPGVSDFNDLRDLEFSLVIVKKDSKVDSGITGFSILGSEEGEYFGIIGGVILILVLLYFVFFRENYSDDYFRINNRINDSRDAIDVKNFKKSREIYATVKRMYSGLKPREKKKIYSELNKLYSDILISEIEEDLGKIRSKKDIGLLKRVESKINSLPEDKKGKVKILFNKIKEEIGSYEAN